MPEPDMVGNGGAGDVLVHMGNKQVPQLLKLFLGSQPQRTVGVKLALLGYSWVGPHGQLAQRQLVVEGLYVYRT